MVENFFLKKNIEEEKRWQEEREEEEMDLVISFSLLKGSWNDSLENILKSGTYVSNLKPSSPFSSQETMVCCNTL